AVSDEEREFGGLRALLFVRMLRLGNAHRVGLVETENLARLERDNGFRVPQLFAVELNAALFDQAPRIGARFLQRESLGIGVDDDSYDVGGLRGKSRQLSIAQSFFAEASVPVFHRFFGGGARV